MNPEKLNFQKYVAAGNDFIMIDNWDASLALRENQIIALCDRRFGVGADGILMLGKDSSTDFRMHYYNADGSRGEMCGNGARSLVKFAASLDKAGNTGTFLADDGIHGYAIQGGSVEVEILVNDHMHPVDVPQKGCGFINTGVPHVVVPVKDVDQQDLDPLGHSMNDHPSYPEGTNVNLVADLDQDFKVRTWERGVNMETLACGTGATAVALFAHKNWSKPWPISLAFPGGVLTVDHRANRYWLRGPAGLVFEAQISLSKIQRN